VLRLPASLLQSLLPLRVLLMLLMLPMPLLLL
jgi:hypothetical protein